MIVFFEYLKNDAQKIAKSYSLLIPSAGQVTEQQILIDYQKEFPKRKSKLIVLVMDSSRYLEVELFIQSAFILSKFIFILLAFIHPVTTPDSCSPFFKTVFQHILDDSKKQEINIISIQMICISNTRMNIYYFCLTGRGTWGFRQTFFELTHSSKYMQ